ncbi:MAG: HAMP domain-containing methyl-accepting chemotaxis protein [Cyanobacteria bacterium P01_E01_bin.45]
MVSSIDDNIRDRAMQAFAREEYSEATQLFEQLTNESPEDLSLKLWLASSQQWSGYPTAARETYESVLAGTDDPDLIGAAQNGLAQLEALQNSGSQDQPERLSTASLPAVDGEFPLLEDSNVNFNLDEPSMTSTNTTSNSSAAETAEIAANATESADRPQNSGIIGGPSLDAPNNDFMFDEFDENELFADVSDETSTIIPPIETQIFSNEFGTGDSVSGLEEIVGTPADEAASDQTVFANNDGDIGTLGANMSDDDFAFLEELHDEVGMIDEGSSTHFAAVDDYEFEAEPFTNVDDGSDVVGATLDELPAEDSSNTMIFDSKPETFIPLADDDYAVADDDDNLLLLEDDSEELFDAVDLNNPLESSLESSDAPSAIETAPTSAPQRVDSSTPLGNPAQAAATQGIAILAASTLGFFGLQAVVPSTMIRGIVGAAAGTVAGAGAGLITARQQSSITRRNLQVLSADMEAMSQGNYTVRTTISSGTMTSLGHAFNYMAQAVEENLGALERRAAEQGQAKEDLQRQVIRLLDDVEGAARGDLTVRAEVTADVLGAVADSFNLTIASLREIVGQVKQAATAVNDAANDNEVLARDLSNEALRQADEISNLLNSVQVMTQSIQDVAGNAKEAEEVAQQASETAIRGGEAVERTAAGILAIRETVAETTRQVKRLGESSQEISKIVAFISQIASRTNLLALNASIEAARAGEAGRGFAIVADEVRQLSDRSSKASKEIEQIVMQIQSETSQVMTAMEEGTQQVIEGTKLAEQAKSSLDEIIQVSKTIDGLVRSITAATVEQTDTSRTVAQVMQNAELTSNETSQEAQKVSSSLMKLVAIARDLQSSVGKFRTISE